MMSNDRHHNNRIEEEEETKPIFKRQKTTNGRKVIQLFDEKQPKQSVVDEEDWTAIKNIHRSIYDTILRRGRHGRRVGRGGQPDDRPVTQIPFLDFSVNQILKSVSIDPISKRVELLSLIRPHFEGLDNMYAADDQIDLEDSVDDDDDDDETAGNIPVDISSLTALEELHLDEPFCLSTTTTTTSNASSGLVLKCLRELHIRGEGDAAHRRVQSVLSSTNPPSIHFPNLRMINLIGYKHCQLPEEIGRLGSMLEELNLSLNTPTEACYQAGKTVGVTDFFPKSYQSLKNLKKLSVHHHGPCNVVSLDTASVFCHWTNVQTILLDLPLVSVLFPMDGFRPTPNNWPDFKTLSINICDIRQQIIPDRNIVPGDVTSTFDDDLYYLGNEMIAYHLRNVSTWTQLERLSLEGYLCDRGHCIPLEILSPLGRSNLVELNICTHDEDCKLSLQGLAGWTSLRKLTIQGYSLACSPGTTDDKNESESLGKVILDTFDVKKCSGFFYTGPGSALNFATNGMDWSQTRLFRVPVDVLGGDECFTSLCQNIFVQCYRLEEVDLTNGNIFNLAVTKTKAPNHREYELSVICSTLRGCVDTLRILDLSNNPALSLSDASKEEKEQNIRVLWNLARHFPYLGYMGKFNMLFLGRLGEDYERLGEYYRLVHQLAVNRARSRVLSNQTVPRGLWGNILSKSQRAFDDYPGHVIAHNRKEEPDAIFTLLQERGAKDIFF